MPESRARFLETLEERNPERELVELEQSVLDLVEGDLPAAETRLRQTRRRLQQLEQSDVREKATSVVTDDRAIAWSCRPFERQMLLNMLTITSILNDGQDTPAYTLQLTEASNSHLPKGSPPETTKPVPNADSESGMAVVTVSHLEDTEAAGNVEESKAPPELRALALSAWIRAMTTSESSMRWQECEKALADLKYYGADEDALKMASESFGVRNPKGHGGLQVMFLVGQSPEWVSERAQPTSTALLMADRILTAVGEHSLPPTVAPVKIAKPHTGSTPSVALTCEVFDGAGNSAVMPSATVVDLNAIAKSEYLAGRDKALARAVVRRIVKKGAVVAAKNVGHLQRDTIADLAVNLGGIAWEAMEKPDLRSWRTLPATIEVAGSTLPEGNWNLRIAAADGPPLTLPVQIADGRNTLVVCILPDGQPVGSVLVGGADRGVFATAQSEVGKSTVMSAHKK